MPESERFVGGVAVIFPGQGSQAPGMGAPWRGSPGWRVVEQAGLVLNEDFEALLLDRNAGDRLTRTREAQLAVFLTSLAAWESGVLGVDDAPVAFAGHSLGQLTALVAAGALSVEEGVILVARRAEATQAAADATPGRMAALLGATPEQGALACAAAPGACWVANDNAPGQVVVAGTADGVDAAVAAASDLGVRRATPLKVGGAFHTPLMTAACAPMRTALEPVTLSDTAVPVVANGDALAHRDGEGWRTRLVEHLVSPVRWRETQLTLSGPLGATTFVEVGAGGSLSAMAKRTVPDVATRIVNAPLVEATT
jgi:[acyl-carrier-protein] S-malonyltransferase